MARDLSSTNTEEMEQAIGSNLLKDLALALEMRKHGDADNSIKLLKNGLRDAKTLTESWLYKMCIPCLIIKTKLRKEELHMLDACCADLISVLNEEQGIPISMEGILLELLTICNILSVSLIKVNTMCKPVDLRDDLCYKIIKTLRRDSISLFDLTGMAFFLAVSLATDLFHDVVTSDQNECHDFQQIVKCLLTLQKKIKINASNISLVFGVFALSIIVCLFTRPGTQDAQSSIDLARGNVMLAKMIQDHPNSSIVDLLLVEFSPSVLEHHAALIPPLCALAGNSEDSFKFVKELKAVATTMKDDENSQIFNQIIQASLYLIVKDYDQSCCIGEHVCRLLEKDKLKANDLLLNTAWNIVGVSYFQLGKPNLAIRAFEKASLASLRNMAPLMNTITALDALKQHRVRTSCIQQMLIIHKNENHFVDYDRMFDFQELLTLKLCRDVLENIRELKPVEGCQSLVLFRHCLDEEMILKELADSLYCQKRFQESSDIYLTLLRKLRNSPSIDSKFKVDSDMLSLYHKTTVTLLKGNNYNDALTVSNYLSEFGNNVQTEVKCEGGGKVIIDIDVINSLLRIELLRNLNQRDEAFSLTEKLVTLLEENGVDSEPIIKRPRVLYSSCIQDDRVICLCKCRMRMAELRVLLFNNLGVMYDENGDKNKALDAFKNAIKTTQGLTIGDDVLFNYCKILLDFGLDQVSHRNWVDQKGCSTDLLTLKETLSKPYIFLSNDSLQF